MVAFLRCIYAQVLSSRALLTPHYCYDHVLTRPVPLSLRKSFFEQSAVKFTLLIGYGIDSCVQLQHLHVIVRLRNA
ncbi:hypothetical protein T4B_7857 [Trichinella pseudospiralis]|uniref:Uncharacterized protein n=1 Tax=Trichinella pseudospiralis TaxID=6337 RepID=A0A0V1GP89_TRIPS|nr:hypothetical protein T4B_7857 [Trichinella pseudospiralis]